MIRKHFNYFLSVKVGIPDDPKFREGSVVEDCFGQLSEHHPPPTQ